MTSTDRRDFRGAWDGAPAAPWPGGARLAVSVVVNVEEGAERSVADGDPVNESVYEARQEVVGAPDPCMESHYAYGPRAGYRRIAGTLARHGVPATFSTCGRAATRLPWLMADLARRGHEASCHGWLWETHAGMAEAEERAIIARTHAAVGAATGVAPRGWHTRSASSPHTRRLLGEHGGFLYDSDCYDDDVPRIAQVAGRPHVLLPYAFDTNDMRFEPGGAFVHAEDFSRYCLAAFDRLMDEGATEARMMSVGLHLRIIGRPARIGGLEALLDRMSASGEVWFATRARIAARWREAAGLPEWTPATSAAPETAA
ncbi:Peptidoglycan/xylan/chitin deacetylase, PgdA/CDA1 family [Albimonas donghaensis]|uniref:Chitooligosaccharide deacetylase n=1 Tax=Albimonas donghaensis TaxID=356660 RepID=A0A1H3AHF1_9RHOB|nr:polysaccharide deacetylase family protein [Albimonas donghaensis]SDX29106.1 Peptidoglycan/xylan/chitin deacetylase, PgdA/CDA1 family [Albimonas donghaensis]